MALDRTWYNTLVDDDGSNTVGTIWNKAAVDSLMDAVDASLATVATLPITEAGVTNLVSDLALKAPLASPTFTGTPAAPTAAAGTNTTQVATTAYVQAEKHVQIINRQTGDVPNSGTGETTLKTYTLPAAKLAATGDTVRIRATGSFAANANLKSVRLYFGATVVAAMVATGFNGAHWIIEAEVSRTGAATQTAFGGFDTQASGMLTTGTTPAETLSGTLIIKCTGTSGTGSNDVICKNFCVEFLPAA